MLVADPIRNLNLILNLILNLNLKQRRKQSQDRLPVSRLDLIPTLNLGRSPGLHQLGKDQQLAQLRAQAVQGLQKVGGKRPGRRRGKKKKRGRERKSYERRGRKMRRSESDREKRTRGKGRQGKAASEEKRRHVSGEKRRRESGEKRRPQPTLPNLPLDLLLPPKITGTPQQRRQLMRHLHTPTGLTTTLADTDPRQQQLLPSTPNLPIHLRNPLPELHHHHLIVDLTGTKIPTKSPSRLSTLSTMSSPKRQWPNWCQAWVV